MPCQKRAMWPGAAAGEAAERQRMREREGQREAEWVVQGARTQQVLAHNLFFAALSPNYVTQCTTN